MGFFFFPIWVWGSGWWSFGPPELRYNACFFLHGYSLRRFRLRLNLEVLYICYWPAGRTVQGKTVTDVLKRLPEAAGRGHQFQAQGLSFALYRLTLSRPMTSLSFFFPAVNWLTSGFVYATFSFSWLTRRLQTIRKKCNERTSEKLKWETKKVVLRNRFISDFFLLVAFKSPVKFCKSVFSV